MSLDLTILGASPAAQNPGGACSSYLIRGPSTAVVLDCGSGSFSNLQRHIAPEAVAAVIVSHLHADHILDLIPYRYYLSFTALAVGPGAVLQRPLLLLPPDGLAQLLALVHHQDPSPSFFHDVFEVVEYDPGQSLTVGELTVSFYPTRHIRHTYGIRITTTSSTEGPVFAYSADSGPTPALLDIARGADLFLCEASLPEGSDADLHLTASQAGAYAHDAGAARLVLTHRWHRLGLDAATRIAGRVFDGPVSMAREGDSYAVGAAN